MPEQASCCRRSLQQQNVKAMCPSNLIYPEPALDTFYVTNLFKFTVCLVMPQSTKHAFLLSAHFAATKFLP